MRVRIKYVWLCVLSFIMLACVSAFGIINSVGGQTAAAEEQQTTAEYAQIDATEMQIAVNEGVVQDPVTRDISVANGCRVSFADVPANMEMTANVSFSATPSGVNFGMYMRGVAGATSIFDAKCGYAFANRDNGMFYFYDNGVAVHFEKWGSVPLNTTDLFTFKMKTVNVLDGTEVVGVRVTVTVNGTLVVDYTDTTDPILSDGYAGFTAQDGAAFTIKGNEEKTAAIDPTDFSDPINVNGFNVPAIDEEGNLSTTAISCVGVGYNIQTNGFYSIKTTFKPQSAGSFSATVGSFKTSGSMLNIVDVTNAIDAQWGWRDLGYRVIWTNAGGITFTRSYGVFDEAGTRTAIQTKNFSFTAGGFVPGGIYEIEYGFEDAGGGVVKLYFKVNGAYAAIAYDYATGDGYEPYKMRSATPSDLNMYSIIFTDWCAAEIEFEPNFEHTTATQLERDLGTVSYLSANTQINRNGEVSSFGDVGVVFGYNSISAESVSATFNFKTIGSALILMLRTQSVVLSPWGAGSGYALILYPSGQISVTKEGNRLCEGWAPYSGINAVGEDYQIEFGAVNVSEDVVRVYAYVNDVLILNYADVGNLPTGSGYEVYNVDGGFSGSVSSVGVAFPEVSSDKTEVYLQETATLSCSGGDNTEYFINEELSTGAGIIDGNTFIPRTPGDVYVYALSDGLYSDDMLIKVNGSAAAITNIPVTALTARGDSYQLEYELLNGGEVTSAVFEIVDGKGTGRAELTPDGLLTPVDAGTVVVQVTVNGLTSPEYTVFITPVIRIDDTSAMAVGEVRNGAGFYANCLLPDEEYTVTYELVDGEEYVSMNAMGQIQAKAIGIFWIKVTVKGETFIASSAAEGIQVEAPVVTLLGVDDMVVGEHLTLYPGINKGIEIASAEISVTQGADCVSIDENNVITALKAGTVKLRAIVNGFASGELTFMVSDLSLTLIAGDMLAADTQTLGVMFNSGNIEIENVTYSIVDGEEFASIENDVLISGNASGVVVVSATVNGIYTAETTINIISGVTLNGVYDGALVAVDSVIPLSYLFDREGTVNTVEYSIGSGTGCARIEGNNLVVVSAGRFTVTVTVNGIKSDPVTLQSYSAYSPIAVLKGVYEGAKFAVGSQVELSYAYGGYEEIESVVYEVVSGSSLASVSDGQLNILGAGEIGIRVVVNGTASEVVTIEAFEAELPIAVVTGIYEDARFTVGDIITLSYAYSGSDNVQSVKYEIVAGNNHALLNDNILTLTGEGTIGVRVTVNGISSETVNIVVHNPVVTLTGIYDGAKLTVGDRLKLSYLYSGSNAVDVVYEITEGADNVSLTDNILTVIGAGSFTVRVKVNGFYSLPVTVSAESPAVPVAVLMGIYDGATLTVGDRVELSYFYSGDEEIFSVEYTIAEGSSFASITDGMLLAIGAGRVGITVTVNGIKSDTVFITVEAPETPVAVLLGVNNGQQYSVGSEIELSYFFSEGEAETVEYKILQGGDICELNGNVLTIKGEGVIRLQVVVNGVQSEEVEISGFTAHNGLSTPYIVAITAACVFGVALAGAIAAYIARRRRS